MHVGVQAGDYYAMTMNYATIGLAVFYGSMSSDAGSHGAAAKDVSQASFFLLMLINSLTSTLDATKKLGEVAGHTKRIAEFMAQVAAATPLGGAAAEARPASAFEPPAPPVVTRQRLGAHSLRPPPAEKGAWQPGVAGAEEPGADGLINAFGSALPEELAREVVTLLPPTAAALPGGGALEVSVHQLGSVELQEIVRTVFPAAPAGAALLAVCTYQPIAPDDARTKLTKQVRRPPCVPLPERAIPWRGRPGGDDRSARCGRSVCRCQLFVKAQSGRVMPGSRV